MTGLATRTCKTFRCSVCQIAAEGEIHAAALGPFGAEWVRPPEGWWVLLGMSDPHVRCPDCLPEPTDDPQAIEVEGGAS